MAIVIKLSYVYIFSILFYNTTASPENHFIKPETVKIINDDMPTDANFVKYSQTIRSIIEFCEKNKDKLTINLVHGLFLINANLDRFKSDTKIPERIRSDLKILLSRTEKLNTEFHKTTDDLKKILAALASNVTSWAVRLPNLNLDLLKQTYAFGEFPPWDKYVPAITDFNKGVPNPTLFQICAGHMITSNENFANDLNYRCEQPDECQKAIKNGTDFGYWLTHRLILILIARFARNCALISAQEDQQYRKEFCEKAYREAEYIALNGFQIIELFLEQISICSIDGNAQFLRQSWMVRVLEHQQPGGCFQLNKVKAADTPDVKNCDDNTTGMALSLFSSALRYIFDKGMTI